MNKVLALLYSKYLLFNESILIRLIYRCDFKGSTYRDYDQQHEMVLNLLNRVLIDVLNQRTTTTLFTGV